MLNSIDYAFILLYFVIIAGVALLSIKFAKSTEDFLVAGRRLSFPIFFSCMAAIALGGGSTIGSVKLGYLFGLGGIWLNVSIGTGLILIGVLISSKLSKLRALSINEVIEANYGKQAKLFSAILTLIYTITLSVVQVIAIGEIISASLGFNFTLSVIIGGGVVVIYTFVGGMWSVTLTDVIQFIIKTIGFVILAPIFTIYAVGGWDSFIDNIPQSHTSVLSMGWNDMILYIILYVPGLIIGQDIWQRIFTAKNNRVARSGTIWAGIYSIVYAFATVIVGTCVFILEPGLSDPQSAFTYGITHYLPIGLKGIILAAAMAATMSVSSATILASSTILYNDFYLQHVKQQIDDKRSILVNRFLAILVGVIIISVSLWIRDLLVGIQICYGYLSGCVFVPVLASFLLKKFDPKSGMYSLLVSFIVVTFMFIWKGTSSIAPILYGMLTSFIVYLLFNLISKNKVNSYFVEDK